MRSSPVYTIAVDRELTPPERELIDWLLSHGLPGAREYLPQLGETRVIGQCSCGCPSIDLAVGGVGPNRGAGMVVLSDYLWPAPEGILSGVVLFGTEGRLACLEAWSVDGLATPTQWPLPQQLVAYEAISAP
jgi:hypothetical protein